MKKLKRRYSHEALKRLMFKPLRMPLFIVERDPLVSLKTYRQIYNMN